MSMMLIIILSLVQSYYYECHPAVRGGTLCLCNCEIIPELTGEPAVGCYLMFVGRFLAANCYSCLCWCEVPPSGPVLLRIFLSCVSCHLHIRLLNHWHYSWFYSN